MFLLDMNLKISLLGVNLGAEGALELYSRFLLTLDLLFILNKKENTSMAQKYI